jgi:hypothetical protein
MGKSGQRVAAAVGGHWVHAKEAEPVDRYVEAVHGERPAREAKRRAAGGEPHREERQRRPERHPHGTHGERGSTVRAGRLRGAGGAEAERG